MVPHGRGRRDWFHSHVIRYTRHLVHLDSLRLFFGVYCWQSCSPRALGIGDTESTYMVLQCHILWQCSISCILLFHLISSSHNSDYIVCLSLRGRHYQAHAQRQLYRSEWENDTRTKISELKIPKNFVVSVEIFLNFLFSDSYTTSLKIPQSEKITYSCVPWLERFKYAILL